MIAVDYSNLRRSSVIKHGQTSQSKWSLLLRFGATLALLATGVAAAQASTETSTSTPCASLSGKYENLGPIVDGPERHRKRTGLHWRVFDGARKDFAGLDGKIEAVRLEAVDERTLRVTAINRDGTAVGPYFLGLRTPWRCAEGAFVNVTESELSGEFYRRNVHERTTLSTDVSGSLIYEIVTSVQERSFLLLGAKIGKPEVTRRAFVFARIE
jgi:hypothetical protein